jgi:hypothetical protein
LISRGLRIRIEFSQRPETRAVGAEAGASAKSDDDSPNLFAIQSAAR